MKNSLFKRAMATVAAVPLALTQCLTYSSSYAATNETQTFADDNAVSTQADVKTYTLQGEGGLLFIPVEPEVILVSDWYVTFHKQLVNMGQEHTVNYIKKEDIESQVLSRAGAYSDKAKMALDLLDGDIELTVDDDGDIILRGKIANPDYSQFIGSVEIPALKALEEVFEKYEVPQEKIDDLMKNPNTEDIKEIIKEYDIDVDEVAEAFGMTPEELAEKYGISKEQLEEIQKSGPIIQSAPRANDESESGTSIIDFSKLDNVDVSGTFEIVIRTSELDDNEGENIGVTFKYIANNNGNPKELAIGELPEFAVEKLTELKGAAKEVIYDAISDEVTAEDTFKGIEAKLDKIIRMVEKADSYKGKVKTIRRHPDAFDDMGAILKAAGNFADRNSYVGKVENKLNKDFKVPSTVAEIMSKSVVATAYDTILSNINSSLPAFDFQISSDEIAKFADEELKNIKADAEYGTYILTADFKDLEINDGSMKHLKASVVVESIDNASEDLAKVGLRIWRDPVTTTTTTTETTTQTTETTTITSSTEDTDSTTTTEDPSSTTTTTEDPSSTTTTTEDPSSTTTTTEDPSSTTTTTEDPSSTTTTTEDPSSTTTTTDDPSSTTTTDDPSSTTITTDDPSSTTTTTEDPSSTTTTTDDPSSTTTTTDDPSSTTTTDDPSSTTTTTDDPSSTTTTTDDPSSTTTTDDLDSTTTTTTDDPNSTTTTTDNTDSTTTTTMSGYVKSYAEYNTETATYGFYFSHDDGTYGGFHAEQIDLGSVRIFDVYEIDGEETVVEREDLDIDNFNFNNETPASMYSASNTEFKYNVPLYYGDLKLVDRRGYEITIEAYIGVKGDVNFSGKADSVDASQIFSYYADLSTGGSASTTRLSQSKLVGQSAVYDEFAAFLGDVNEFEFSDTNWKTGKSGRKITSVEGSQVLAFYALVSDPDESKRVPAQEAWDTVSPDRNGR